jgi:hypothetical protein
LMLMLLGDGGLVKNLQIRVWFSKSRRLVGLDGGVGVVSLPARAEQLHHTGPGRSM